MNSMVYFKICSLLQLLITVYGELSLNDSLWDNMPKDCGGTRYDNKTMRIIDGEKAALGQFPWIAEIGKFRKDGSIFFFCGASLITRYYLISAAHCEEEGEKLVARLGENYKDTDRDCDRYGDCAPPHQDVGIKGVDLLNFDTKLYYNDLSLMELEKPVQFNEFVQPVCLPRSPLVHQEMMGMMVKVAGWGVINADTLTVANDLMFIVSPIVEPKECSILYTRVLMDNQFCVGYITGGKDSCTGDSGGPATREMKIDGERRTYLVGVISYGLKLCGKGVAVYTDVSYHTSWILNRIKSI